MSVKDFYNAVTPGSTLTHGVGRGVYTIIADEEICTEKTYEEEKLPTVQGGEFGLLNNVGYIIIHN